MKKLLTIVVFLMAGPVLAGDQSTTFDMDLQDGTLAEAAELVNGFCAEEIDTLEVRNPDEVLTLKLEAVSCEDAAKLLREFDSGKA